MYNRPRCFERSKERRSYTQNSEVRSYHEDELKVSTRKETHLSITSPFAMTFAMPKYIVCSG